MNNEGANLEKAGDLQAAVEKYRKALELDPAHNGIRISSRRDHSDRAASTPLGGIL